MNILIVDIASIILLFVIASLSKRLGEALHAHKENYRIMYISIALISLSALPLQHYTTLDNNVANIVQAALKGIAGLLACGAIYFQWNWLFNEFMSKGKKGND